MPLGEVKGGKMQRIPRPIPPELAHEQGAMALIRNVCPSNRKSKPMHSDHAAKYIQEYAKRSGPMNDQFVRVGIIVTLGDKVLFHMVPDAPSKETKANPSEWNGHAARVLLWYARNALNPNYNLERPRNAWHDDGCMSSWTPNDFLHTVELDNTHPFHQYGHYMLTVEQGGVLGWLYGKTNPPCMGPRYQGVNWLNGLQAECDGTRTRPIHALLVAYRMGSLYGESVKDALLEYFKCQVPEEPPPAATYLPELDEKGKRVKMYDYAAEELLDRMLKSDSPFVRTAPEPYPFHDKPLVVVPVPLSRVIYGYGNKFVPKAILWRYYEHWGNRLSITEGLDILSDESLSSDSDAD